MLLVHWTKLNPPRNSCNHGPFRKPNICLPFSTSEGIWSVQTNPVTISGESRSWTALRGIDETNETVCKLWLFTTFSRAVSRCMGIAKFVFHEWVQRCCTELFHAFSPNLLIESVTHTTGRLTHIIVKDNCIFRVMGQETCRLSPRMSTQLTQSADFCLYSGDTRLWDSLLV